MAYCRLTSSNRWLVNRVITNSFPFNRAKAFLANIALISSGALNETTEDQEALIVDLSETVVISRLGNITTLFEHGPVSFIRIKFIGVRIIVAINNTTEYYNVLTEDGGFMMTNISGALSGLFHDLPAARMLGLLHQFIEASKAEPPHVVH